MAKKSIEEEREIVESVTLLIEAVIRLPILERHKRGVISGMLWELTQIRGKYTTRYRSRAALEPRGAKLQHEHVFTRKDLTDRILANPERAREILGSAVACVVTVNEHRQLAAIDRTVPGVRGCERYERAGIEVLDTDLTPPAPRRTHTA